ncbi:sec-independent protein translocase protein TatB-like [Teleopsis dalmanni]|uniref:sec-independent protein translocase protein TatB-like n=1 Tax=Teleopsis dalmanni TaxID=139649 RepID=UPI0018CD6349|nr:sec-independent protein translocase protein TatB-like [Teleopsis dalmanni]
MFKLTLLILAVVIMQGFAYGEEIEDYDDDYAYSYDDYETDAEFDKDPSDENGNPGNNNVAQVENQQSAVPIDDNYSNDAIESPEPSSQAASTPPQVAAQPTNQNPKPSSPVSNTSPVAASKPAPPSPNKPSNTPASKKQEVKKPSKKPATKKTRTTKKKATIKKPTKKQVKVVKPKNNRKQG